ncbi:DegV family protein [Clostridiaceae bacterium JG1575]|nr:DegV family protein [Clostridiaceae bacterium JG1575]
MFAIITDSGSDLREEQAQAMGVHLAHLTIHFEDETLVQRTNEDVLRFYEKLKASRHLPRTSQPSPQDFLTLYEAHPEEEILVLTLSSRLSGTYNSAVLAQSMLKDPQRILILDTQQATMSLALLVQEAVRQRAKGRSAQEVFRHLQQLSQQGVVFGLVDTLKYLKKGGRIPPSLAALGTLLHVKPLLELKEGALIPKSKARGKKAGRNSLLAAVQERSPDPNYPIIIGTTGPLEEALVLQEALQERFAHHELKLLRIGGIIGTHVGPGCFGVGFIART